jgi:cardiolipin synthase (CMP-forming)
MKPGAPREQVSGRVLTMPNVLSTLRLLGVPVFLWAIFTERDGLALIVLVLSGATDYLDGKIARRYQVESRLGQLLDPVADRLYIISTLGGLAARAIVPWWLVAIIVGRELFMAVVVLVARRHGWVGLPVHFAGKAATLNLLYAFPLLLLGAGDGTAARLAEPVGWAFAWWGMGLYWLAGGLYAVQLRRLLADRAVIS